MRIYRLSVSASCSFPRHPLLSLISASSMVSYSVSGLRRLALVKPRATVIARGLASLKQPSSLFAPLDTFTERHVGPDDRETSAMLSKLGYKSMEEFLTFTKMASHSLSQRTSKSVMTRKKSLYHLTSPSVSSFLSGPAA